MRRARLSLAALLGTALLVAGCGGGSPEDGPEPSASPEPSAAEREPRTSPFTGLEVERRKKQYPPLVVKIDNTSSSAPQRGLGSADLVVEEMVEGGLTRLAVFFYSTLPEVVGPVRSMRATDIGIVAPAEGALVTSGGAPVTVERIRRAGIPIIGLGSPGVARVGDRSAPYDVMANLQQVAKAWQGASPRPGDYLPFGPAKTLPKGKRARSVTVSYPNRTDQWEFRNGAYHNTNSYAASGDAFAADTVLVLRVRQEDAGYRDPAGNPVPESVFEGEGAATLFHDGRMVTGTWHKKGLDGSLRLRTRKGDMVVPPGHTWIHLVPRSGASVSVGR